MASEGVGLSELLSLGIAIAAQIAVGMALGWLIDSLVDTFPLFALIGLGVGIVGACVYTIVEFRKYLGTGGTTQQ